MKKVFDTQHNRQVVCNTFLFCQARQECLDFVFSDEGGQWAVFEKDSIIYNRTHYKKCLGIIVQGSASVYKQGAGAHPIYINLLQKGDVFGGAALYQKEKKFIGEIKAVEKCTIFFISQQVLNHLFELDSAIAIRYIEFLSGAIQFLNRKIDAFTLNDVQSRFMKYLAEHYQVEKEQLLVCPNVSFSRLAQILNVSRASLYRCMKQLEEEGYFSAPGEKLYFIGYRKMERKYLFLLERCSMPIQLP